MDSHLIIVSRERIIGTEVDETSNLIYTMIKIRSKKYDGEYIQSKDYPYLVEKELTKAEIANFKANRHLYTKVESNEYGTIYQYGSDFKKTYWSLFPKEGNTINQQLKDLRIRRYEKSTAQNTGC